MLPIYGLLFVVLALSVSAAGMFLQRYLYEQPVAQIYWRGPAAALIVTLYCVFWTYLDYRNPGNFNTLLEFSTTQEEDYPQFWVKKRGQEILYERQKTPQGRFEYRDARTGKPFSRSDPEGIVEAIIVENKDKERLQFDAELTSDGKFKVQQGEPARFVEVGGRKHVMTENTLGKIYISRPGLVFANLFLNFLHLVVWFLVLWLFLQFQVGHAVLISLIAWLVMTLALPFAFRSAEAAGLKAQKTQTASVNASSRPECA